MKISLDQFRRIMGVIKDTLKSAYPKTWNKVEIREVILVENLLGNIEVLFEGNFKSPQIEIPEAKGYVIPVHKPVEDIILSDFQRVREGPISKVSLLGLPDVIVRGNSILMFLVFPSKHLRIPEEDFIGLYSGIPVMFAFNNFTIFLNPGDFLEFLRIFQVFLK